MSGAGRGFERERIGPLELVAREELLAPLVEAGFAAPWNLVVSVERGRGTGRGPRGVVALTGGRRFLVKQCLRGGLIAKVNRSRYLSHRRFEEELALGLEAERRGLPVAPTCGVAWRRSLWGYQVWSVAPFVEEARDLARIVLDAPCADRTRALLAAAVDAFRVLHEGGLVHHDLNLGNVMVSKERADAVTIVDLDKARLVEGVVPRAAQERVRARFLRSWNKVLRGGGALPLAEVEALTRGMVTDGPAT